MTLQSIVGGGSQEHMAKKCKEATCLADLGRKISADYIAQGYVGRFSGRLTIKVELYSVRSGNLIGQIADASGNLEGLLAILESQAPKLFGNMPGVSNEPEKPVPLPPPPVGLGKSEGGSGSDEEEDSDKSALLLGIRAGFNSSQLLGNELFSNSTMGLQLGLVLDIAMSSWFHIQPGLMYIQKGAEDYGTHYMEVPLLLSLKFYVFRINAGPYFGICVSKPSDYIKDVDVGISSGLGFDIGRFYIGTFFDLGLVDISNIRHFEMSNGTFGFNFGVNL
jgi:hypothetical protein